MKILFLTIGRLDSIEERGIYTDLLREFRNNGHEVYVVVPREKRENLPTELSIEFGVTFLRIKTGNITKTNIVEKGISTILITYLYKTAIKKYYSGNKFDIILYSTPPITLSGLITWIKNRDGAISYLLLKDIFPQNAVDMGLLSETGIKGFLFRYFRKKERKLYVISDFIGCMSQANVDYILNHNPEIKKDKVKICPNSIEPTENHKDNIKIKKIRQQYNIPKEKTIFIYGGNLGKPQGVNFIVDCLRRCKDVNQAFFVVVGSGTEFYKLKKYVNKEKPDNLLLMNQLSKEDYSDLMAVSDVGLVFLDHRFTIPNFPSRLLDYMNHGLPVVAATDVNTDIGKIITDGQFGWCVEAKEVDKFKYIVDLICTMQDEILKQVGVNSRKYLENSYTTKHLYDIIMENIQTISKNINKSKNTYIK